MKYQITAQFRKSAEADQFATHVAEWKSITSIHVKGRKVVWTTEQTDDTVRQHVLDLQETVHYFGSPELGNKTKSNSSWITSCIKVEESTTTKEEAMPQPTKIVATVVRAGQEVRLANRKDTELGPEYIKVGDAKQEGNLVKVLREDGTVYASVGLRAKFELKPEEAPKAEKATATSNGGVKVSKHARKHLDELAGTEGHSTTRGEWHADPMIVKSLEGKGLITVTRDENEKKRASDLIELTDAGRKFLGLPEATEATEPSEDDVQAGEEALEDDQQ